MWIWTLKVQFNGVHEQTSSSSDLGQTQCKIALATAVTNEQVLRRRLPPGCYKADFIQNNFRTLNNAFALATPYVK